MPAEFVRVDITDDVLDRAVQEARGLGVLQGSILKGGGNVAAYCAKIVAAGYLEVPRETQHYDYDFTCAGLTVSVKAKQTNVDFVDPEYDASIPLASRKQGCDAYLFARVNLELMWCWLLGWLPKNLYFRYAHFLKIGQVVGSNKFAVKADCFNVSYSDLRPVQDLKELKVIE